MTDTDDHEPPRAATHADAADRLLRALAPHLARVREVDIDLEGPTNVFSAAWSDDDGR